MDFSEFLDVGSNYNIKVEVKANLSEKIYNVVFKSTNHGLDSDFIEMFDYVMNEFNVEFEKSTKFDLENEVVFETLSHKYVINYENIIPEIHIS